MLRFSPTSSLAARHLRDRSRTQSADFELVRGVRDLSTRPRVVNHFIWYRRRLRGPTSVLDEVDRPPQGQLWRVYHLGSSRSDRDSIVAKYLVSNTVSGVSFQS